TTLFRSLGVLDRLALLHLPAGLAEQGQTLGVDAVTGQHTHLLLLAIRAKTTVGRPPRPGARTPDRRQDRGNPETAAMAAAKLGNSTVRRGAGARAGRDDAGRRANRAGAHRPSGHRRRNRPPAWLRVWKRGFMSMGVQDRRRDHSRSPRPLAMHPPPRTGRARP